MLVIKRNGSIVEFNFDKIRKAVIAAFESNGYQYDLYCDDIDYVIDNIATKLEDTFKDCPKDEKVGVEFIQDTIEECLMGDENVFKDVAKSFIIYRAEHAKSRDILNKLDYMEDYSLSSDNAADLSQTDANANVGMKNVVTLEADLPKLDNREIQRARMKRTLNKLFPEVAHQYEKDINSHIIYIHDEASSAVPKNYCEAVSLYPMLFNGVKDMDGITPEPAKHLSSFCGQFNNLVFLLSAQCKGAVAFGEFFNFFDYFCVKDYGPNYHLHENEYADTPIVLNRKTVGQKIEDAFQTIVCYINQPAQNRGWQSPFTNISYYDEGYWRSLFKDFYFPDGSQPEWERVSYLQKKFMKWFNKERTKALYTFPVETMALLLNEDGTYQDSAYKNFTAEMYSEGHSFFTYISKNPNGLASCCRLRNEILNNIFSFTNGLTGVKTGSCNVITLNMNRIVQNWAKTLKASKITEGQIGNKVIVEDVPITKELLKGQWFKDNSKLKKSLYNYIVDILERVYKYHIAYKTILYDWEDRGMFSACNAGYINMRDLFSTIGINGVNEAARFLGMEVSDNEEYKEFCRLITGTISEQNRKHNIQSKKRPFLFNTEFVPAEGLSSKNYNWDFEDNYWVPDDTKIYNSYFYNAWDDNTTVLDRFRLHGRDYTELLDGGVGLHCNLNDHLSKEQYLKLMDYAAEKGTSYFTFNIPNSECTNEKCHFISKHPLDFCPKCGAPMIQWSRVVGFLRPVNKYDAGRRWDYNHRIHSNGKEEIK